MEQTLATAAANFARHNNNDLKDVSKSSVEHQQAFMSQLLKFQALNMSMQNHHSHQNINNKVDSSDNEPPTSPDEAIEKDELEASDVEEEELPIDLQRTSEDGASVQSQTSPRSPSSDAGMSTSSAGKADKGSRLEQMVSRLQRASPSLPKEAKEAGNGGGSVNGCNKRKRFQPAQVPKSSDEATSEETAAPDAKKLRDNEVINVNYIIMCTIMK